MRFPWLGVGLILIGLGLFLDRTGILHFGWMTGIWLLLAVFGGFTLVRGLRCGGRGGIFWGLLLLAFAGYRGLSEAGVLWLPFDVQAPLLLTIIGTGFLLIFVRHIREWAYLVPALFFLATGAAVGMAEVGVLEKWQVREAIGLYWPLAMILFGSAVLLGSWRNRAPADH